MKTFFCDCGHRVFFDSFSCLACGRPLGFDPAKLEMVTLAEAGEVLEAAGGDRYKRCENFDRYGNCNWLLADSDPGGRCASCRLNDVIPALERPGNLTLWSRVEQSKRRLLYSLFRLHLPLSGPDGEAPMRFRILEDRRRNPDVFETFVATAHFDGTITINIAEADDAARLAVREQMQERYRTVLGHLRHESAHYYFSRLANTPETLAACRDCFGDERADYAAALQAYYESGPVPDWPSRFVSAYASAHPAEDFAETFAHFLHIDDALETARAAGLAPQSAGGDTDWISDWVRLAITLNEILRSLGADDPYPFVLTEPVKEKLQFMSRLLRRQVEQGHG